MLLQFPCGDCVRCNGLFDGTGILGAPSCHLRRTAPKGQKVNDNNERLRVPPGPPKEGREFSAENMGGGSLYDGL